MTHHQPALGGNFVGSQLGRAMVGWKQLTAQATAAPVRDGLVEVREKLYLRSYLRMRVAVGILGLALPVLLVVGDALFLRGGVLARGSLSAYYHSGMRDIFVSVLVATGIFLMTYKVAERNLDNVLTGLSGAFVIGVAVFPTGLPSESGLSLTPLQARLGETTVSAVHFTSAALFILLLSAMSFLFGRREGNRLAGTGARSSSFWKYYHFTCAYAIVLAVVFIAVTKASGVWDEHSLLIGETVAVIAFGLSWLMKGWERDYLRNRR